MNSSDRTGLYQSLLTTFLARAKERGYIVIGVLGRVDEYVQFIVHDDRVSGEVGSRQWSEPERPLPGAAVAALGHLGFTGGGPERNFAKDGLPRSAAKLAKLTDTLLRTAYDLDEDFSPVVHEIHLNDVTLPRAEPFTREMIEAHLRDLVTHFLRDEDGDFRVELNLPDGGGQMVLWLVADGKDGKIYHVHAHPPEGQGPPTRTEALERCNTWNRQHRWPKACVMDAADGTWRIVLGADIDLSPGITRSLFDTFTERTVGSMIEFWTPSAAGGGAPEGSGDEEPSHRQATDDGSEP
ncbi:MAG: YbjN domain-containing protein [Candidatus Dormibacteria bacterium]